MRLSFEEACAQYVHRFTCEHVPAWALKPTGDKYPAPHFRTDREWYDNTIFPGEPEYEPVKRALRGDCWTRGHTFPAGSWLDRPFRRPGSSGR